MRIALFTDTFPPTLNGVARAVGLLTDHATRAGHEVTVVAPDVGGRRHDGAGPHIALPGPRIPFYRELRAARPWLSHAERRHLSDFAPDLVHSVTEAFVGMAGRRWALANDVPFVSSYCTNFADYLGGYGLGLLEPVVRGHLRRFHGAARTTFCPSEATRRDLTARGFHPRLKIWGRGVDTDLFNPSRRSEAVRAPMVSGAEISLVYVGRIAPEKKIGVLMEALPMIREGAMRSVSLTMVGGGPALEGLKRRGEGDIHFAGYRRGEDLAAHYASGDIFVFPSDTETFGQVVTEAMASGLPVVAPSRGGVTDTVVPGETGYLFEPGDSVGMAAAVVHLVNHEADRIRMGRNARALAESLAWPDIFRRLFAEYEEVVEGRDTAVTRTR